MNHNFYFLIYFIILFNIAKSAKLTKNEVLKLNLKEYSNAKECPEFGYKYTKEQYKYYPCYFTFYCKGINNCQSFNNTSPYFVYIDEQGKTKKYIQKSCNKEDSKCTTEKCKLDTDCLSNNCYENKCVVGNSEFVECSDVYYRNITSNNEEIEQFMKCGKPENEKCKHDSDCSGKCTTLSNEEHNSNSFCESHVLVSEKNQNAIDAIASIGILFIVLAISAIIIISVCCCCLCFFCCV